MLRVPAAAAAAAPLLLLLALLLAAPPAGRSDSPKGKQKALRQREVLDVVRGAAGPGAAAGERQGGRRTPRGCVLQGVGKSERQRFGGAGGGPGRPVRALPPGPAEPAKGRAVAAAAAGRRLGACPRGAVARLRAQRCCR